MPGQIPEKCELRDVIATLEFLPIAPPKNKPLALSLRCSIRVLLGVMKVDVGFSIYRFQIFSMLSNK